MKGSERRSQILEALSASEVAVSGSSLAQAVGVSRQVVVQDIALLRANGHDIIATNKGYVLRDGADALRPLRFRTVSAASAQTCLN